ncbi:MAG: hypothetical protein ACK5UE_03475 [Chitinophagales bacterium]|jgi:hypothetical protein|nr:hypothetical protein [Sphingobacteriales bacterium]
MRYLFVLLILFLSVTDMSAQKKKVRRTASSVAVTLHITQTVQWCGGARPTEEMEKEFNTPKPYPNYNLFIRKDSNDLSKHPLFSIQTNESGKFTLKLPPGKYVVVDEWKKNDSTFKSTIEKYKNETSNTGPIDTNCYKYFVSSPDFVIIVPKKSSRPIQVKHNYHKLCNWSGAPCVEFRGPYPP